MGIRNLLQTAWQRMQAKYYEYLGQNCVCACGHTAKEKTILVIGGSPGLFTLPEGREYCPECFKNAVIQCAWCGKYIIPGSAITLHSLKPGFQMPKYAVRYSGETGLQLVGCLRSTCSDSGMDRAGFWIMPGKVQRALSPVEMAATLENDEVLIINDLHDMSKAVLIE